MSEQQPIPPTPPPPPPPPVRRKRKKNPSRADRWSEGCSEVRAALDKIAAGLDELQSACEGLRSVQEEFEQWKDNLPENLANSPLGEKLDAVCSIEIEGMAEDIQSAVDDASNKIDEAEGADLPLGFGRD